MDLSLVDRQPVDRVPISEDEAETLALAMLLSGEWGNISTLSENFCDLHGIYGEYGWQRHLVWNAIYIKALNLQGDYQIAEGQRGG
jgi:hypothetical protein